MRRAKQWDAGRPGIVFKDGPAGRRAAVAGTGLNVWEIVEMHRSMGRDLLLESMANVPERTLDAALRYREAHPEEVEAAIAENALGPEHWHRLHPETVPPDRRARQARGRRVTEGRGTTAEDEAPWKPDGTT